MFLKLLLLEFFLVSMAGLSLFGGSKGIMMSGIMISAVNLIGNFHSNFWFWESIIILYSVFGFTLNNFLNHKTDQMRVVKVTAGSVAALLAAGLLIPFIPGFIAWTLGIGIPLVFTYREIPKALYLQIIFKFIFSIGWLIIGNILY
ncbi:MAG: hypothetical protein AWM53_00325 [Candidatus Dichloromethanomonas elyunquensis]|nr:MAG: hypothetical protein AWM53_00325 [Candidatus Dichloromethanomonas elyunquensis]